MNPTILMLEHDEDDRYITQSMFEEHKFNVSLHFVTDSRDLIKYLQDVRNGGAISPSLILLNYVAFPNDGISILKELKSDNAFKHIPVVVLSGTVQKSIIRQCYEHGACSFIQKPSNNKESERKISNFFKYWFQTVELV
jgi:CheY-like chemotaxis protein